ncbi:hypothetical protein ACFSVJ_06305 [Prauserella oleivorans]
MIGKGMGARRVVGVEVSPQRREWADGLGVFDATLAPEPDAEATAGSSPTRSAHRAR